MGYMVDLPLGFTDADAVATLPDLVTEQFTADTHPPLTSSPARMQFVPPGLGSRSCWPLQFYRHTTTPHG